MLRLRLFYGLLTIVVLLWGVGGAALLLMNDSSEQYSARLKEDYQIIDAAQSCRTITATLNSHYLPQLATPVVEKPLDRSLFDKLKIELQGNLNIITNSTKGDPQWAGVAQRFDQAIDIYCDGYENYFSGNVVKLSDRAELLRYMSTQTQRLTDMSENIMSLGEKTLFGGAQLLGEEAGKNILLITTLVILGTTVAALIYYQLVRHMVDPVAGLTHSIEEIRKGNFELVLPTPGRGSEFTSVASAFNDMAAELKVHRMQTNENLQRANLVNRAILEAIPSPVYILSDDTKVIQMNPAAENLSEKVGIANRIPLKIQRILDDCRENGSHFLPEDPREALLFRIEEKEYYYLPRIFRFESENHSHSSGSGWAILLHNVSRIRWLDDMKTNLIATVSHEIKTPLTGIRMVLHLLMEERTSKLDEMQKTMVSSASEDCERLLGTLNSLLDLSRAESGTTHLTRHHSSLQDRVETAATLYADMARAKDVQIHVSPELPNAPKVYIDSVKMDEVLNNLVSNAIKHSPQGGKVSLAVTKPEADFLRVSVIDEGPGVPETAQSRIFERFYRAPGQDLDGVGLGLFISREIMRAHEGRIGLMERSENQTEFYIDVPIA